MGWRSVIISQHAKLSYASHLMVVQTRDGINQVPIEDVQLLLVSTTQAVITTALLSELAKQNAKVVFVDRNMQPNCELVNNYPNNRSVDLLIDQFNWSQKRKELLWTKIVHEKIKNQIQVLQIYKHETEELSGELEKLEVNDLTNREAVVARKYFPLLFEQEKFSRRSGSAVNAALNYGYSILLSMFDREIVERGYLTYLGIHHRNNENQFNLGSDLMEPFRPVVDYWVANQDFTELTPDVKYGLIDALNIEITYCEHHMLLRNAISKYVGDCLKYLSGQSKELELKMELNHEVPNNALINHV
ncbi:type II CRISPR-associated endonuclease Cas1 [Limosilactobacillus sp.]|uniref:type II CRISPR-associated endonuclease Cas1 n=1 Tax=Limosilactobacillus sp. TaxID=2773925 RepID=UPI0025C4940C|nr:type II CRISPR-associated endonuclease Cas1 [Limosilactobacillus sp.]MCH3922896.1 type II CRISPR-associated endonuclease Cas1 [Limosilactobacillus sp.]MCH3927579.1 type II CRISPR-associated endonuclease Cas1 [Limosilactobacillus sp.]